MPQLTQRLSKGVTLIETLIALMVFAVGMLGLAALMGTSMRYHMGHTQRTHVTAAVDDIAERIRTNITAANGFASIAQDGITVNVGSGYVYEQSYATQTAQSPSYAKDCRQVSCTPTERASYDVNAWLSLLGTTLTGGAGLISGNVTNGFDVTVMWLDKDNTQSNDAQFTDALEASNTCTGAEAVGSAAARFCCPAIASAPNGVRCYRVKVMP